MSLPGTQGLLVAILVGIGACIAAVFMTRWMYRVTAYRPTDYYRSTPSTARPDVAALDSLFCDTCGAPAVMQAVLHFGGQHKTMTGCRQHTFDVARAAREMWDHRDDR